MSVTAYTSAPLKDKTYQSTRLGRDIADFLAWGDIGGWSHKTLINYEANLVRPAKALDLLDRDPADITGSDLVRVAQFFPAPSRRTGLAAWRSFYKWCRRTRRVLINPCEELPDIRKNPQPIINVFSQAEIDAILSLPVRDAAPAAILLEAGLRKQEASDLQVKHCLPESGQVLVMKGKGSKSRVVPMSPRLQQLLADLLLVERLEPDDHIFYATKANQYGTRKILRAKPVGAATFARWWRDDVLAIAGVDYRNPHVARHTRATLWRQEGLSMDEIAKVLGHASSSTTETLYVHTTVNDVADRMRLLGLAV